MVIARRMLLQAALVLVAAFLPMQSRAGCAAVVSADAARLAIRGYDTVAYFTDGKPVQGIPQFESVWQGARWRFANAEHRELFMSRPESYAPRFGGYCIMALTHGETARSDPEAWIIIDGRLYLGAGGDDIDKLKKDPAGTIAKAEAEWNALGNY
jgi:hypothetical protein